MWTHVYANLKFKNALYVTSFRCVKASYTLFGTVPLIYNSAKSFFDEEISKGMQPGVCLPHQWRYSLEIFKTRKCNLVYVYKKPASKYSSACTKAQIHEQPRYNTALPIVKEANPANKQH